MHRDVAMEGEKGEKVECRSCMNLCMGTLTHESQS
jgi:hypothetical protein